MLEERIYLGDNLELLPQLPDEAFALVYIDPPFNTGREQRRLRLATEADASGTAPGSADAATGRPCSEAWGTPTATTTTWPSSSRDCAKRIGCYGPTAPSTSISTHVSRTTARCSSTRSSGANAS